MTNDQRLDRLERTLAKCLQADDRSRSNLSATDKNIQILIDAQIKYEEQFGKIADRSARIDAFFASYKENPAKSHERHKKFEKRDRVMEILERIQKEL